MPKLRNIPAKLPKAARALLKPLIRQVFRAATCEQGLKQGRALIARWRARYPAAMEYRHGRFYRTKKT